MSADSVVGIGWDVLNSYVVVPIERGFGYVISTKRFADHLRGEVQKLENEDQRVKVLAEEARRNVRKFLDVFTTWEASAEKALEEARELLDDFERATKACCYGTLPKPISRYQFSRKAEDKIKGIKQLTQTCSRFNGLNDISFIDPDFTSSASTSKLGDDGVFESRALMIRNIMGALADNSNSVVGVYGMGGIGKSTLLVDVERKVRDEKSFHSVAKADVSKNPDIKTIQGEIADALGLTEIKDKETISGRAKLLHDRLKDEEWGKKKVLIILDNLWEGLDLKKVGIPCRHDNKVMGCQLLMTSRNRDVLRRDMGCDKDFSLGGLKDEEAKRLFEKIVGDKVNDDELKSWVNVALDKCAGVPFLIVAMAKRFKDAKLYEWRNTLKNFEEFKDKETGDLINHMLQWSYDKLEEDVKSVLRLCVVYSISKPSVENLVRYGFGLGLFGEVSSMEVARDRLRLQIRTLQASSLLLDSEDIDGFKIHDLVREFVASVASRDHPILVLKDKDKSITELSKDKLKTCRAICFPYVDIQELPQELDCSELQIFLLFTNNRSLKVPYSLFHSMRKLTVLNLTRICLTCSSLSPFQFLENLHTLCLDGCSLDNVAILGELKGLQILSFVNSNIHRLPKEIGQLVELRLLELNYCPQLKIIEPGVLRSLIKLEELYMKGSFNQWNTIDQTPPTNASLIELNHMKNLRNLHVSIPNSSVLPEDLNVKKLTKYEINMGNVWCWWSKFKGSRTLDLKSDPLGNVLWKRCIQSILGKTDTLFLDNLDINEQSVCTLSQKGFPKLKYLQVQNSSSIHYILQLPSHTHFTMLESLLLKNLINLEMISNSQFSSKSFSTLKVVRVESCDKMEVLFPLSVVRGLPQLEEIEVVSCKLMRTIIEADDCGQFKLRNLHVLKLCNLPYIKSFFNTGSAPSSSTSGDQVSTQIAFLNGQQVAFPSLETLDIKAMDIEKIWDNQVAEDSFHNLKSLYVDGCNKLVNLVPSCMLGRLLSLEILGASKCGALEVVFKLQPPNTPNGHIIALPLKGLTVSSLPELKCVWDKELHHQVKFQCLSSISVFKCKNLTSLFPALVARNLLQLEKLKIDECGIVELIEKEEGLVPKFVFPKLISLELKDLRELKCIYTGKHTFYWPALKSLKVHGCDKVEILASHLENEMPLDKQPLFLIEKVAFPSLEALNIASLDNIEMIWDNQVAANSFPKLKSLCVDRCNKLVNIVCSFILRRLLSLERLDARRCGSLEVVFELQPQNHLDRNPIALPLKELTVSELPKLKCVWDKELCCQFKFQGLRSISISRCESLTSLFPTSVAKDLMQLEELKINECGIAEIIEKEDGLVPRFVFPKLTSLELKDLRELKCLYIGTHTSHWPELKSLKVHGCDKVEILASHLENEMPLDKQPFLLIEKGAFPNLQELKLDLSKRMEIWHGHFHDGEFFCKLSLLKLRHLSQESSISTCRFVESLTNLEELVVCESYLEDPSSNEEAIEGTSREMKVILPFSRHIRHLQTLDVSHCDGLPKMFTPTIAENLVALTKLRISNCRILTEVINDEKGGDGRVVVFNQLKYMELDGLIGLRSFSLGGYTLMFPLLEDIIVTRCPNMKFFSQGLTEASKLKRVQVSKETWFWAGNLNITIQNMFEEMGTFAGVEKMLLYEFPGLIGKWHTELNPIKSYWQLKSVVVDKCPSFINAIPSRLMLVLDNLGYLQVRDCELLEEIFDLEGFEVVESTRILPRLRELNLANLPKLRQLWKRDLQKSLCFNSLRSLILYNCSNLGHAFSPSMAQCLANLELMEIKECGQMQGVIVEEEGEGSAMEKITFSKLWHMTMEYLPNLTCFLLGKNRMLECPKLEIMIIAHCPKMESLIGQSWMEDDHGTPSFFTSQVQFPKLWSMDLSHMDNLSKIWTDTPQETLTFDCLWEVEVQNCKGLENLFPYWVATSLTHLEKLQVESCEIKEIVANGGDTPCSNTTQDLFPELTSLVLREMPRLKSFYPNLPTLHWPLLKELRVTHCGKLNMLSFTASMNSWAQKYYQQDLSNQEAHSSFERDFPNFERLLLVNNNIQMIQDGNFPDDIFSKPIALTLACFHDENAIFPSIFLLERFRNLQSLEVFCSSFEDIFPDEGLVEKGKHPELENLREIKLNKLRNLKRLWRESSLVSKILQSIETFEIWDCPYLTTIFPKVASFQNLTKLVVKNSSGLVHLVTVSTVTNLMHLKWMTIIGCEKMKEVVANDGNGEGKVISFENLQFLTLKDLPSLECFSSISSCTFKFPCLLIIIVEECPKMKTFSKGTLSTPKLYRPYSSVSLFRYKWIRGNWEEGDDLNTTIQKLAA